MSSVSIFWFRRDLRLHDNCGLYYALKGEYPVLPLFIFDKQILDDLEEKADRRVQFLHEEISAIKKELSAKGSTVVVRYGTPEKLFQDLADAYDIKEVYTNRDYEPYARERDKKIDELLKERGIGFYTFKDQVIFEKDEIKTNEGNFYKVFTPYKNSWMDKFASSAADSYTHAKQFQNFYQTSDDHMPSLDEMGFKPSDIPIPSRELDEELIKTYGKYRNFPAMQHTSRIGMHLRFGTVSIREMVQKARQLNDTWLNELIWREFYMMILWHNPRVVDHAFKSKYDNIPWENNEEAFALWCQGKTGYPIVDAGMRQLNQTGYMHNRVRMIVASFLTKHLLIDWRWGEAYFAKKLLDYELSSNNGGWQWAASTGTDAQPYFRIFNPYSQAEKFDKDQKYVKEWIPELDTPDYPDPIVAHKAARERALEVFKKAVG